MMMMMMMMRKKSHFLAFGKKNLLGVFGSIRIMISLFSVQNEKRIDK
jgi:hypothetical protein